MHLDEAAGVASYFGTLTASGWHALAFTMRLAVEMRPFGDQPIIGKEYSLYIKGGIEQGFWQV